MAEPSQRGSSAGKKTSISEISQRSAQTASQPPQLNPQQLLEMLSTHMKSQLTSQLFTLSQKLDATINSRLEDLERQQEANFSARKHVKRECPADTPALNRKVASDAARTLGFSDADDFGDSDDDDEFD